MIKTLKTLAAGAIVGTLLTGTALAQGRDDVIIAVGEQGPSSLDTHNPLANDYTRLVAWNVYDRLVSHGSKTLEDGTVVYDVTVMEPELAESWEMSEDGKTLTFKLREDAVFHDGSPVTAEDVKWSFDRAVSAGGFPAIQMGASFFTDPEQFAAIDEHTFQITLPQANKYVMANLTVPVPVIVNKDLALEHATEDDPWAFEWVGSNDAGGGAYKVARWTPGSELVLERFDEWKSGPLPEMQTVVYRQIPSAGTRRALVERGDADISIDLPPKDFAEMDAADDVDVISVPVQSSVIYLELNTEIEPFDDPKVRQALAYALPYEAIMANAYYGRAIPMFGADPAADYEATWPVASPYYTDMAKAKQLLAEAGYPDGFETEIFYDISRGTIREPMAILIKESLAELGIDVTIQKVPGANWFAKMLEKSMPMVIASFYAWLDWPEYHFYWTYHGGNNSVFNAASYVNPELDALIDQARAETDPAVYDDLIRQMNVIAMEDVPKIPLARNYLDTAIQSNVEGYKYWFHTQLDFRALSKS
jgi:peptide/nickel transport system substrate-binding protein